MIVVLAALAVIVLLIVVNSFGGGRSRRDDETERFHRAAHLTSQWARAGVTQPVMLEESQPRERERESASAR